MQRLQQEGGGVIGSGNPTVEEAALAAQENPVSQPGKRVAKSVSQHSGHRGRGMIFTNN